MEVLDTSKIGGKTLDEWERSWLSLGILESADLSHLSKSVGLYKATLKGKIVFIGRATEHSNGGLCKRLSDYIRSTDSSRDYSSGQLIHQNAANLEIEVLITGDDESAGETAKKLKEYFIDFYKPEWNKMSK